MTTILIVDDEQRLRDMIKMILENRDYHVLEASNGEEAILLTRTIEPNLILMDVMMPVMDGMIACRRIREFTSCPVIMLTAKGEDYDQVEGLSVGADDYVVKPFSPIVLVARIEAVLRRYESENKKGQMDNLVYGKLIVDSKGRSVIVDGKSIDLSRKEFDLLEYMVTNHDISLSRDQILENVWGYDYLGTESTVDSHINRLRSKLSGCEQYLKTLRGYGYKFEVNYEK